MATRDIKDFQVGIIGVVDFLSISRTTPAQLIGSSKQKAILYNNDYDLEEHISNGNTTSISRIFQLRFKEANADPDLFITDFKCGLDSDGEPLRWNKIDVARGWIKMGNGSKKMLKDTLAEKATIKLDAVAIINDQYTEFSCNYYIGSQGKAPGSLESENLRIKEMGEAVTEYANEGQYFKALKRKYALKPTAKMLTFFNSNAGLLWKAKSQLELMILLIENKNNFRPPTLEGIINNLQTIKQFVSNNIEIDTSNDFSDFVNKLCLKTKSVKAMKGPLEALVSDLAAVVNEVTHTTFFSKTLTLKRGGYIGGVKKEKTTMISKRQMKQLIDMKPGDYLSFVFSSPIRGVDHQFAVYYKNSKYRFYDQNANPHFLVMTMDKLKKELQSLGRLKDEVLYSQEHRVVNDANPSYSCQNFGIFMNAQANRGKFPPKNGWSLKQYKTIRR